MKVYTPILFYARTQSTDRVIWVIGLARKYIGILSHDFLNILYRNEYLCGKRMLGHFRNLSLLDLPIWRLKWGKFEGEFYRWERHMRGYRD